MSENPYVNVKESISRETGEFPLAGEAVEDVGGLFTQLRIIDSCYLGEHGDTGRVYIDRRAGGIQTTAVMKALV